MPQGNPEGYLNQHGESARAARQNERRKKQAQSKGFSLDLSPSKLLKNVMPGGLISKVNKKLKSAK